jgi:hypothetical protein
MRLKFWRQISIAVVVAAVTASCSPGSHYTSIPSKARGVSGNVCPLGTRHSAAIAAGQRRTLIFNPGDPCGNNSGSPNGDPLFFQVSFYVGVENAIDGGVDPCGAPSPICDFYPLSNVLNDIAASGAAAARGDNCTNYNSYSVGFSIVGAQPISPAWTANVSPTPANGPNTIVDQAMVGLLSTPSPFLQGSQVIGWLLTTEDAGTWFVPNATLAFGVVAQGTPGAVRFSGMSLKNQRTLLNAIRSVMNAYSNTFNIPILSNINSLLLNPTSTSVALQGCFTQPLNPWT